MHPSSLTRTQWTVYLIHHPHTDIGYTDSQERIEHYHIQFLDRAIELHQKISLRGADADDLKGFKWTSECFWSIDRWLRQADAAAKRQVADAIRDGVIGLSATYLHFTELIDAPFLLGATKKAIDYGKSIGVAVDSALSADVNGFSWGYADVLAKLGVKHLMVCSHSHHGLAPIGKRQLPFRWKAPGGGEVLVWNGEHYMLGNSLGLAPGAVFSYTLEDELHPTPLTADNMYFAQQRLPRYLRQLEIDNYPYDFVPLNVAGMITDNAPPNEQIATFLRQWNAQHGPKIKLQMVTLSEFFARLRKASAPIPTFSGDWPDWWSDGVASNVEQTMLFRSAQRKYRALIESPQAASVLTSERREQIEEQLVRYAEHTFSHSDSMRMPWDQVVKMIAGEKKAAAYRLASEVEKAIDDAQHASGQAPMAVNQPFLYRVTNPTPWPMRDVAHLFLEHAEFGARSIAANIVRLEKDGRAGSPVSRQRTSALRGLHYAVRLDLAPHASATLELREGMPTVRHDQRAFNDGARLAGRVSDVAGAETNSSSAAIEATNQRLVTPFVHIEYAAPVGITAWRDPRGGRELIGTDRVHAPFTAVYEITPVVAGDDPDLMMRLRRAMGRNRKGPDVQRHVGELIKADVIECGPLFATVALSYKLQGTKFCKVLLTAYADLPRVDVRVRLHKESVWAPENLYLALPFTSGAGSDSRQLWIEKAGALVRPWHDQLPDTLADFYCIQEGFALQSENFGLAIATPDAPLLQLGPLEFGQRKVMGHPDLPRQPLRPYSWLMSNYWETNFEANLGGFHEFCYHLEWGDHLTTAADAIRQCRAMNLGYRAFRVNSATAG
jgi:hypothetical protein